MSLPPTSVFGSTPPINDTLSPQEAMELRSELEQLKKDLTLANDRNYAAQAELDNLRDYLSTEVAVNKENVVTRDALERIQSENKQIRRENEQLRKQLEGGSSVSD